MDPYDAIVELLRDARDRRQQSLEQQLAGVVEGLESAAASIREALATPVAETLPLDEVESSLESLKAAALEAAVPPPPPPVTVDVLRALDGASSQSELLHGLLSELAKHAGRAVVLVFRPDGIGAWSAIGFDDVSRLGQWSCGREDSPVFQILENEAVPVRMAPLEDGVIRGWLRGETEPDEALLVPICLRGRTMGAVYADRLPDGPWDPEAVQVLVAIACWMIDTLKYRADALSPMLRDAADAAAVVAAAAVEPEESVEDLEEAQEVVEEAGSVEVPEPEPAAVADVAATAALDEMAAEPGFDPSATVQVEAPVHPEPLAGEVAVTVEPGVVELEQAASAVDSIEEEMEVEIEDETVAGSVEQELPPPVEPVAPPADFRRGERGSLDEDLPQLSFEDQSQHEEARRFARLLVSEIKLYNEDAVERGRQQRDLYQRLKDDIDRSREMYDKRIPSDIRAAHDHFKDELVRILAGGDAGALGM